MRTDYPDCAEGIKRGEDAEFPFFKPHVLMCRSNEEASGATGGRKRTAAPLARTFQRRASNTSEASPQTNKASVGA